MKIENGKITTTISLYELSMQDTVFDRPIFVENKDCVFEIADLNIYCDEDIQKYIDDNDIETINDIIDELIDECENDIIKSFGKENSYSTSYKIKRYEENGNGVNNTSIEKTVSIERMLCIAMLDVNIKKLTRLGFYGEDIKQALDYASEYLRLNK